MPKWLPAAIILDLHTVLLRNTGKTLIRITGVNRKRVRNDPPSRALYVISIGIVQRVGEGRRGCARELRHLNPHVCYALINIR